MKIWLFLLCFAIPFLIRAQGITLSGESPSVQEPVTLVLEKPAREVWIEYRPNSQVVRYDTLRATQPATTFEWTPRKAGVVRLSTPGASRNVSVRFAGLSGSGLAVMIVAAILLFGGATFAFRILFKDERDKGVTDLDIDHLPDT
jgi:hypothetical protein